MGKSFGYDSLTHEFIIARHQIGDFGLHLSLIRSISSGANFPVESPFYPGIPLPYHYLTDVVVGLIERLGVRIDIAFNGLSAVALTALLYLIYLFPQRLFKKSTFLGLVSVTLFIFHSSLTSFDFLFSRPWTIGIFHEIWRIPDYIHAGPFDGSIISTFFTLNVLLNQRHLIAGLALGVWIVYSLVPAYVGKKLWSTRLIMIYGVLLGILGYIHSLVFVGISFVLFFLFFKKPKYLLIFVPAMILMLPRLLVINQVSQIKHTFFNPGFLAVKPLTVYTFIDYWWQNLGVGLVMILFGVFLAGSKQKLFFFSVFSLFVIANMFQFSYRIDHNHSLLNLFILFANFYGSYFLFRVWKSGIIGKALAITIFVCFVSSGVLDLMAVKNDFHVHVPDAPKSAVIEWIRTQTPPNAIFLAPPNILDPVTLAGRYNYLGHDYYLSVMGYDTGERRKQVKQFFEADTMSVLDEARGEHIQYVLVPNTMMQDFPYSINQNFWNGTGLNVYRDESVSIYKL